MGNVEVPNWLKGLPLAPEYRPTDTEFADPIAYISKIEKEASAFGICKIIPPFPKPSKKFVFSNLNKSLAKCPELGSNVDLSNDCSSPNNHEGAAVFTTRQQELGQSGKKAKGVSNSSPLGAHKQVWQSGEIYTLDQFESKAKAFSRNLLGTIKEVSPLVVESLFWKATSEKPMYIEYANDVPGSAFGETGGRFQSYARLKRKRASYQRRTETYGCEKIVIDKVGIDHVTRHEPTKNGSNMSSEARNLSGASPASQYSRRKSVACSNDIDGTAGWKLSTSPWNLQAIARASGSLTRFMPDDIPGVTSPMIYIGMLFSWFAWHVEDHELHSLNFLHTGSAKTWYAVPGDYGFAFEEVIHTQAYGGCIDPLAALALLGEKTTLLSPEIIVASGIPCCRLIQNPGEFVVTFPRAYHVGFSQGFNCGEAANFGTPQWLNVAKDAAVRRAAMNFLPMLSHQQLLYLLTMSFVSRVPRSLLPGARTSRSRDQQKQKREILVKKAFIDDMLSENKILSTLFRENATYRTVLWDLDLLLPFKSKDLTTVTADVSTTPAENLSPVHSKSNNNTKSNNLLEEISLYMENLNELYLDDDDMLSEYQVNSGTLTCVACGILGFPFMSVVQPFDNALMDPVASECNNTQNSPDVSRTSEDLENKWNVSSRYLRPRIFCLEHTVQVQKLLESQGGANVLVICHKDYQKIKAHATAIAEEIKTPFRYDDVPLESASQKDLKLIDLAIDDEHNDEGGEDWTSKMGINLQNCIRLGKNSPSKQVQLALTFGGLFADRSLDTSLSNIKWQSRKSRSKGKLNRASVSKLNTGIKSQSKLIRKITGKENIIQYTRRKKLKSSCSTESNGVQRCQGKNNTVDSLAPGCADLLKCCTSISKSNISDDGNDGRSLPLGSSDADIKSVPTSLINSKVSESSTSSKRQGILIRSVEESCRGLKEMCASIVSVEVKTQQENGRFSESSEGLISYAGQVGLSRSVSREEISGVSVEEPVSVSVMPLLMDYQPMLLVEENNEIPEITPSEKNFSIDNINKAHGMRMQTAKENMECEPKLAMEEGCEILEVPSDEALSATENLHKAEMAVSESSIVEHESNSGKQRKQTRTSCDTQNKIELNCFMRSPCEGLRPRGNKNAAGRRESGTTEKLKAKRGERNKKEITIKNHGPCNIAGCRLSFETKEELELHKRNTCPHTGCGKKFRAHRYAVLHLRVHNDQRPFKCSWKDCSRTFKWAWARTEHMRLHTGERPYKCSVDGCNLTFRYVSDFSRHRRRTGHRVD